VTYSINDMMIAGRTTLRGVRWHEKQGLLGDVERSGGNHRRYTAEHIRRAKIIAACQMCGMQLAEIKYIVSHYDQAVRWNIVSRMMKAGEELDKALASLPAADEPELDL